MEHKRGRPPLRPEGYYDSVIRPVYPHVKTRRHLQNLDYAQTAYEAICDDQELVAHFKSRYSVSVMAQLGRLNDPELIRAVARLVMEDRSGRVRDIEARLRRFRRMFSETVSENPGRTSGRADNDAQRGS